MATYRIRLIAVRRLLILLTAMALIDGAGAGQLYKYRDESGATVYSDKPPADGQTFEQQQREVARSNKPPKVAVRIEEADGLLNIWADNECRCPAEVALQLTGGSYSDVRPDSAVRNVIGALGSARLMSLRPGAGAGQPDIRFGYVFGDPDATHSPAEGYRPPFAAGRSFRVTQAFPDAVTHSTPDSRYAIDLAMPERTDVYAAREGLVVEVARDNFRGGADFGKYGAQANIVKIMHDDGSFALYAHLSWDSIRVRPGDRVRRGEFIAASGNTGFSTGPHLHFVVVLNEGLRSVSVPVVFSDGRGGLVTARSGTELRNP